jgi:hypothetical protein
MFWQVIKPLLIFPRGLLGGLAATIIMWIAVIWFDYWQLISRLKKMGIHGPVAVAGGWTYLARTPLVIVLLAAAFGLGFYFATRP